MRKSRRIKAKKDAEVANGDEEAAAAGGDGDNDAPVENGEDGKLALCPVFFTVRPQTRSTVWFHSRLIPRLLYLLVKPISFSAPAETAEEAVGTVEEDQPAATTDDATVAESTASVDTASKTRVNTLVSLILLIID